jgi:hypothetical protein
MTFRDLPPGVKDLPLTDPHLAADVIDLMVGDEARASGCIGVMVCDRHDRGIQPIVLTDVPDNADSSGLRQLLEMLLPIVAEDGGSVLIGRGRRRGSAPSDLDRAWHQQAIESCNASGVRLLGFHLATAQGVFPLPEPLSAAS